MTEQPPTTDRPTIDPPSVSDLTEADRRLAQQLVDEIDDTDGAGSTAEFDAEQWQLLAKSILLARGCDPSNVVLVSSSDGVEILPAHRYLELQSVLADVSLLARRYLRNVERVAVDDLPEDDVALVRLFLERSGASTETETTTEDE